MSDNSNGNQQGRSEAGGGQGSPSYDHNNANRSNEVKQGYDQYKSEQQKSGS